MLLKIADSSGLRSQTYNLSKVKCWLLEVLVVSIYCLAPFTEVMLSSPLPHPQNNNNTHTHTQALPVLTGYGHGYLWRKVVMTSLNKTSLFLSFFKQHPGRASAWTSKVLYKLTRLVLHPDFIKKNNLFYNIGNGKKRNNLNSNKV